MSHIIVAGAGLAGSLFALNAVQRGHDVTLLERRHDSRSAGYVGGRSINLALSQRGLRALEGVGQRERVEAFGIPMRGRMMHAPDGALTWQRYGRTGEAIRSVSRQLLNEALLDAVDATGRATAVFGARVDDVDIDAATVRVIDEARAPRDLGADLVVGADGAFSAVRSRLMRTDRFDYSQTYLSHGYRELTMPPAPGGGFAMEPNALHIWPRHDFMMIALPNPDRTFTCTVFLPWEGADASFATVASGSDAEAFFAEHFANAVPLLDGLAEQWDAHRPASLSTHRCNPFARGRVVLIGDAAHAVVPFYGQGMNAAFEDCRLLAPLLDAPATGWPAALDAWATARKPDADAIADLALANLGELRWRVADPAFLDRKALEHVVSDCFPESYRSLYELVTFTDVPYAEARARAARESALLDDAEARTALTALAFFRTVHEG